MLQTANVLQGKTFVTYHGIVSGEAIMGAKIVRDIFASVTDIVGGRNTTFEDKLAQGREIAIEEMTSKAMRANSVIGIDLDFETVREGMMMCIATGTAVTYLKGEYHDTLSTIEKNHRVG